ncbi:MAG: hypothetical protein E7488_05530 [Ruminococcaceae bacterium]|nr:hypothetical protein [Oscillospiraceae bacterium]
MKKKKLAKIILLAMPLILGMTGYFIVDGRPFLQSLYISIKLYGFGAEETPPNTIIEIARWVGPVATASTIVAVVALLRRGIHNIIANIGGNSTAVYGPDKLKDNMLKQLGKKGIDGRDKFVEADNYILLDSEDKNLAFYEKHRKKLVNNEVFAKSDSLSAQWASEHNLHLFCPEEIAASVFWKEHCIYPLSRQCDHKMKIAVLGFDKLGRELILSALQSNIFSSVQQLSYHIWGDADGFLNIHHQLSQIEDNIVFHYKNWYEEIGFLNQCNMIIVTAQDNQSDLVRKLLLATDCKKIYLFSAADCNIRLIENSDRITPFDWTKTAFCAKNILENELFEKAKLLNLRYKNLYNNVEENSKNKELCWQKLNTFTRYSNISAADFYDIMKYILICENQPADIEQLPEDWVDRLANLEHIRWCRYHYLNNWKYGKVENGTKDVKNRIHADLVPYDTLSDSEKEKDKENIRILFSLG